MEAPDSVMGVSIPEDGRGIDRIGTPEALFEHRYFVETGTFRRSYDVSPDGGRFLMMTLTNIAGGYQDVNKMLLMK